MPGWPGTSQELYFLELLKFYWAYRRKCFPSLLFLDFSRVFKIPHKFFFFSLVTIDWNTQVLYSTIIQIILPHFKCFIRQIWGVFKREKHLRFVSWSWRNKVATAPPPRFDFSASLCHQITGTGVRRCLVFEKKAPRPAHILSFSPGPVQTSTLSALSDPRQRRSWTLFLTCPSAPGGIPLMSHYGEQMQPGQPGGKQPATLT